MNTKTGYELQDGDAVYVQGHPMIARNPRVQDFEGHGSTCEVVRFEGECIPCRENDSIIHTGFNGGTYGQTAHLTYTLVSMERVELHA